ncbi:hypothetical protein QAD02_019942 [Eretmocerus hayati]|uniref:Uncharacterized protein n=1 Tax=Eretmocerus hayati TaxID=131215 RepID=A0ACC2PQT8_9HYME|nr:hypothetical protein QAD02_019942 [Eretmocerus hayati]
MSIHLYFIRFRREKHGDVEKGDGKECKESEVTAIVRKVSSSAEETTSTAKVRPSKWGRLLGSSSLDSGSDGGGGGGGSGADSFKHHQTGSSTGSNKVFPKLGKLSNMIEEDPEGSKETIQSHSLALHPVHDQSQLQMRKLESYDGGLIVQPSHEREILAAVLEVKVDLKLEVQRVNQRLAKIEDMLQILITRLPASSNTAPGSPSAATVGTQPPSNGSTPGLGAMVAAMSSPSGSSQTGHHAGVSQSPGSVVSGLASQSSSGTTSGPTGGQDSKSSSAGPATPSSARESNRELLERLIPVPSSLTSSTSTSGLLLSPSSVTPSTPLLPPPPSVPASSAVLTSPTTTTQGPAQPPSSLGPLILRKRRSKSRNKGIAPMAPLASQPVSPTEPTESTQMLPQEPSEPGTSSGTTSSSQQQQPERSKRPAPRPRDYL